MTFEQLDQLVKIQQRAGQPVDLVDHHDVYPTGLDIGQETLKGRAVERAAGHAAVVIAVGNQDPTFPALAGDIGLAGLPLGVQRVEFHLEAFLAGFAGVDRATQLAGHPVQVAAVRMPGFGTAAVGSAVMMFGTRRSHVRPG
jgi:hypothetical protein